MPGSYHIISADARHRTRSVRCYETGRYHRHSSHNEEVLGAACGSELIRGRDDSCSIGIATPAWDKDWCHACVKVFPWTEEAQSIWKEKHGIQTLDIESWRQWSETPEGRAVLKGSLGN